MSFTDIIKGFSDFLSGLGLPLLLPIVITILGLVFGQKFSRALRAGLTLGAGFIALNLVIGLLINNMVPVVNSMIELTGANLGIMDVGWGLAAAIPTSYELFIADLTAKRVQEFYNLPGISIPHGWAVTSVPIIAGVNWVLDRIPYVKDIHWDEGIIKDKWGMFGDPLILGVILGIVVADL